MQIEVRALFVLLLLPNLGLLLGNIPASNLIFLPASVASGEWWRVLTWPFVHVSRYHLFIDAAAFLLLYTSLSENKRSIRISYALVAIFGSLALPLLISPEISQLGLCGLSGPAHGLAVVCALEMRQFHEERKIGTLLLYGLLLKTAWELATGAAFLQDLHPGDIGHPLVATHAGGAAAGIIVFKSLEFWRKNTDPRE